MHMVIVHRQSPTGIPARLRSRIRTGPCPSQETTDQYCQNGSDLHPAMGFRRTESPRDMAKPRTAHKEPAPARKHATKPPLQRLL